MFSTASLLALVAAVAVVAGAIASVSGFGIGSLLTPLLAVRVGTKVPYFVWVSIATMLLRSITAMNR